MSKTTTDKILSAAAQIFAHKGFDGGRLEEIADICSVKAASIYRHYKDKESLLRAVYKYFENECKKRCQKIESAILSGIKEKNLLLKVFCTPWDDDMFINCARVVCGMRMCDERALKIWRECFYHGLRNSVRPENTELVMSFYTIFDCYIYGII